MTGNLEQKDIINLFNNKNYVNNSLILNKCPLKSNVTNIRIKSNIISNSKNN